MCFLVQPNIHCLQFKQHCSAIWPLSGCLLCALDYAATTVLAFCCTPCYCLCFDILNLVAGDAEDDEDGSAGDEDGLDELSDTNAPYAEEAQPEAGSSKKGACHNMCLARQLLLITPGSCGPNSRAGCQQQLCKSTAQAYQIQPTAWCLLRSCLSISLPVLLHCLSRYRVLSSATAR
jgi:hypothetical protein